jgi:hypothetical protein
LRKVRIQSKTVGDPYRKGETKNPPPHKIKMLEIERSVWLLKVRSNPREEINYEVHILVF